MKILLDTNIILDVLLRRTPFYNAAVDIFRLIDEQKAEAYISATIATDIYYLLRKEKIDAREVLKNLLKVIDIIGVDKDVVISALYSEWKDFEDAVQYHAAEFNDIDFIITRNVKDFHNAKSVKVLTPKDFLLIADKSL
ncbi:MAG: PIN domain-containing protein [Candidatus Symbiothrix sp.]|jgi:predicted nucleic acid-binding protein|nr:PIN domain-containing protein [Candidatus Symbiothrix sp.]